MRRAVRQVHLWAGLLVGLLATIAGITGSAVVYREALDRTLAPELYNSGSTPARPLSEVLARAAEALPGYTLQTVDIERGRAVWVLSVQRRGEPGRSAYIDPGSGTVLGLRGSREGLMNRLSALHTELLGGSVGTWVNGAGAAGLLLLCLTGVVLWWPVDRRFSPASRLRRPTRWWQVSYDLHTLGGFCVSLPLAVQAFTGVFLCWGFGLAITLFGGKVSSFNDLASSPRLRTPCPQERIPLEVLLAHADVLYPDAKRTLVQLPATPSSPVTIFQRTGRDIRTGGLQLLAFDPCTGEVLKSRNSASSPRPLRMVLWLDAFHFGLVGGSVTQALWVPLGLMPGVLFSTGFALWWRRVLRRDMPLRRASP